MKKIMIAVATIAMAFGAQAAAFKWNASGIADGSGNGTAMTSGTAYLFCVSDISQASLYDAVLKDGLTALTSNSISNNNISNGSLAIGTSQLDYGTSGNSYDFYFAILNADADQIYFSNVKLNQAAKADPQVTSILFSSQATGSKTYATAEGFQGASAWSQVVPEPTSGLLMLIGMAGLALRRRRA